MQSKRRREFMEDWRIGSISVWCCALFLFGGVGAVVGTVRRSWIDAVVAVLVWVVLMYIIGFHRTFSLFGMGGVAVVAGVIAVGATWLALGQSYPMAVVVHLPFIGSHSFPLGNLTTAASLYGVVLGLVVGFFSLMTPPTGPHATMPRIGPFMASLALGIFAFLVFAVVTGVAFGEIGAALIAVVVFGGVGLVAYVIMALTIAIIGALGEGQSLGYERGRADGNVLRAVVAGASGLAVVHVVLLLLAGLLGFGINLTLGIILLSALFSGAAIIIPFMIATR